MYGARASRPRCILFSREKSQEITTGALQNYNSQSNLAVKCRDAIHRVRVMAAGINMLCHSGADAMNRVPMLFT